MKKIIFNLSIMTLLSVVGCQEKLDAVDGQVPGTQRDGFAVYVDEKTTNQLVNIENASEGGETFVDVRLSGLASRDVTATVSVQDFFEQYNKKNNTEYELLPTSLYELYEVSNPTNTSSSGSLNVTIKKGTVSARVGIKVKAINDKTYPVSTKYAIPLKITSASAQVLSNREAVVTFNRPFKTSVIEKVPRGFNFAIQLDPEIPSTDEFTIQGHFMFLNWDYLQHDWNQSMINFRGGEGSNWWYTRVQKTHFQVKDLDADGDATHVKLDVKLNTWYQVSYVYKDNKLKVYVNGKLGREFSRPGLRIVQGENPTITVANSTRTDSRDFRIREVRVWNRALSEAEVNDALYLPVNPENKGLLAYMPLNKDSKFTDVTKWNNTIVIGRNGKESTVDVMNPQWIENVKFPAEGLVIEEP